MGCLLKFLLLYFGFLQSANFGFTTAAKDRAAVTQMGLDDSSIFLVEHTRWNIFLSILNKSKGSISLGHISVHMLAPF